MEGDVWSSGGVSSYDDTKSENEWQIYTHSLPGAEYILDFKKYFRHQKIFHNMGNSVKEKHLKTLLPRISS